MVTKKTNNETKVEETAKTTEQPSVEMSVILKQMEEMQKLILDLQTKNQEQAEQINQTNEKVVDQSLERIDQNYPVETISLLKGELVLRGSNTVPHLYRSFGAVKVLSFEEVRSIYNNQPNAFRNGKVYINDPKIVKELGLEYDYERILDKNKIDGFMALSDSEIENIMSTISPTQRDTIIRTIVDGYVKGDSNYSNINKIILIGKLLKHDIYKVASEKVQNQQNND